MRKTLLMAALGLSLPAVASAQSLFVENFAYADSLTIGGRVLGNVDSVNVVTGWATHSGALGQIKTGTSFNQTFTSTPAYPSQTGSGIRLLASRGEDINHQFAQQVEGAATKSVYVSVVVTPDGVPNGTTGSYFLHVSPNTLTSANGGFAGRVWMAAGSAAGTVKFGITTSGNVPVFAATEYALGTKLLLVMRYDIVPGAANNAARLYVFTQGANLATEPAEASALASDNTGADPANIGAVAIRQGTSTTGTSQGTGDLTLDGVRVGLSWPASNPVAVAETGVASRLTLTALGGRALRIESAADADVAVYDMLGRQVMTQRVASGTTEMRFDGLASGVYVVRGVAGGSATTLSVVVR